MTTEKRVCEIWVYYVNSEPDSNPESIERHIRIRTRFRRILDWKGKFVFRSILIAMGMPQLPHQFVIGAMSDEDFEEFIDSGTKGKRRKEIYQKNDK